MGLNLNLNVNDCLPDDIDDAILLGRAWVPGHVSGPSPIIIREGKYSIYLTKLLPSLNF